MKIVIDSDIPYIGGVFEPYADVAYIKGGAIDKSSLTDASALIVRTRTRCNEQLLGGTPVKFIATATIGTDHIDAHWCRTAGITVASSAGCNARAVAQWVFAALRSAGLSGGVIGIVGVGNVGRQVELMASQLGFSSLRCDPPRVQNGESGFVSLEFLLAHSDVVTIHTPLLETTREMVGKQFLEAMKPQAVLLNSSRGEVVNEAELAQSGIRFGLDVWCNEPDIDVKLLEKAAIATPHIAGYSARGKARGTEMAVNSVADFLDIEPLKKWSISENFALEIPENFDIAATDIALRAAPAEFEALRLVRP